MKLIQTIEDAHDAGIWDVCWCPVAKKENNQPTRMHDAFKSSFDTPSVSDTAALLATCSADQSIRIRSYTPPVLQKQPALTLGEEHTRTIRSVGFSPCARFLAAASFDGTISIYISTPSSSVPSGTTWEHHATLEGHENEVKCLDWCPTAPLLATCSRDKSIWIWDLDDDDDMQCLAVLQDHSQDVKHVRWHPHRMQLVSASYDETIKVWEQDVDEDWVCVQTLSGHSCTVWALDFDSSGSRLASVGADGGLKVWMAKAAVEGYACVLTLALHSRPAYSICWSKEHGCIATGGGDNAICVIRGVVDEADVEVERIEQAHTTDVNAVAWNGRVLASVGDDASIKIWAMD